MNRIEAYRLIVRKFIEHACGGPGGRGENDPVYQAVTEGRDTGKMQRSYSSCGDLAHWMLFRLGVRESWINREETYRRWRSGQNISALCWPPCPSRKMRDGERFNAGDTLVIYNNENGYDAHALVVLEHGDQVILSGDYGQPGGMLRTRHLYRDGNLAGKKIQRVLTLEMALTGSLAPPDWTLLESLCTGEELDAVSQAIGFDLPPRAA